MCVPMKLSKCLAVCDQSIRRDFDCETVVLLVQASVPDHGNSFSGPPYSSNRWGWPGERHPRSLMRPDLERFCYVI